MATARLGSDKDKIMSDVTGNHEQQPQPDDAHRMENSDLRNQADQQPNSQATNKPSKPAAKPVRHRKHRFPWVTLFAMLLVLVLGYGNYWMYQQWTNLKLTVLQLTEHQGENQQLLSTVQQQLQSTDEKLRVTELKAQHNEETQRSAVESLDQFSQQLKDLALAKGKDPLLWRVAEVEYLLSVANHGLVLERNVSTALTALQDADKRLLRIADPGLIPVREKISQEIHQLEILALPDLAGIAAQLNSLAEDLTQLPFTQTVHDADALAAKQSSEEYSGIGHAIKQVWGDLVNGLFKVQRTDQPIQPLLPPDEKQYLLHNLRLKLEQARIALLQRQTAMFHNHLQEIEQWLHQYFDPSAATVQALLKTIQSYASVELNPQLPDISGSLRTLHTWMEQQKHASYMPSATKSNWVVFLEVKDKLA